MIVILLLLLLLQYYYKSIVSKTDVLLEAKKQKKPQKVSSCRQKAQPVVYSFPWHNISIVDGRYGNLGLSSKSARQRHRAINGAENWFQNVPLFKKRSSPQRTRSSTDRSSNPSHYLSKYADLWSAANTRFGRVEWAFSYFDWSRELCNRGSVSNGTAAYPAGFPGAK